MNLQHIKKSLLILTLILTPIFAQHNISGNTNQGNVTLSWTDGTPQTAISNGGGVYSISVSDNWSGTVTPSKTGYTFAPTNIDYSNVITDQTNQNYTAIINQYTLDIVSDGTGSGQVKVNSVTESLPYSGTFDHDAVVNLEAVSATGSAFTSWTGDLTGNTNPTTITMDQTKDVTANFTLNQYTLVIVSGGTGSGQVKVNSVTDSLPYSKTFYHNALVNLEAVPETGSAFTSWTGDLTGNTDPTTITMDQAKNITTNFALNQY
ncbi:MAG: hypothetical protein GY936_16340, partial [Ignavibacteriae bacterium]|nr:hypothetical protein [Ignavibacteriota bacterium]